MTLCRQGLPRAAKVLLSSTLIWDGGRRSKMSDCVSLQIPPQLKLEAIQFGVISTISESGPLSLEPMFPNRGWHPRRVQ